MNFTDQHISWAAALHKSYFEKRPWSKTIFHELIDEPNTIGIIEENKGYIIGRVIAPEAEILMLVVDKTATRNGVGAALVNSFCEHARQNGVEKIFLEVSASNTAAKNLYKNLGFEIVGRRKNYYPEKMHPGNDALVMSKHLF